MSHLEDAHTAVKQRELRQTLKNPQMLHLSRLTLPNVVAYGSAIEQLAEARSKLIAWLSAVAFRYNNGPAVISMAGIVLAKHHLTNREAQEVFGLAILYLDVLLDSDQLLTPIMPKQTSSENMQILALACYLAAAKFLVLEQGPGSDLFRESVDLLQRCFPKTPNMVRCLYMAEHALWNHVLEWKGWRRSAAEWLSITAERFGLPQIARLAHSLPLFSLDAELVRTISPSILARIIINASNLLHVLDKAVLRAINIFLGDSPILSVHELVYTPVYTPSICFEQILHLTHHRIKLIIRIAVPHKPDDVKLDEQQIQSQLGWTDTTVKAARRIAARDCLLCDAGIWDLFSIVYIV